MPTSKGTIQSINPGVILTDTGNLLPFVQSPPLGAIIGNRVSYEDGMFDPDGAGPNPPFAIAESLNIISKIITFQEDVESVIQICFEEDIEILAEQGLIIGKNFPYALQYRHTSDNVIEGNKVIVRHTLPPLVYLIINKNDTPILFDSAPEELKSNLIIIYISPTLPS